MINVVKYVVFYVVEGSNYKSIWTCMLTGNSIDFLIMFFTQNFVCFRKPLECVICSKEVKRRSFLRQHMLIHTGEKVTNQEPTIRFSNQNLTFPFPGLPMRSLW